MLLATLLLGEGGARLLFAPPTYLAQHAFDPELGHRQRANIVMDGQRDVEGSFSYRTNSLGFRSPELPAQGELPPPGTSRVLFIADSFGDGWGVRPEALIPFHCQAELSARGYPTETYNLSYSAIGTAQELLLFRRHGVNAHADVVVLALFEGNDIVDNTPELLGQTAVTAGAYVRPFLLADGEGGLETFWLNPWRAWLRRSSRIYQLLEVRLLRMGLIADPERGDMGLSPAQRIAAGHLPNRSLEILLPPTPGSPWATGWKRTEDILRVFRREVEAAGARFVLASIPARLQVQADAMTFALDEELRSKARPTLDECVDWNLPEKRLGAFAAAEGITFVPFLDTLRAATAATGRSAYRYDGHLNARGHRLAGTRLADTLECILGGRAPPPAEVPSGSPVDLLEQYVAASRVDFGEDERTEVLVWGWEGWMLVGDTGTAGWLIEDERARLYVPVHEGELVLAGWTLDDGVSLRVSLEGRPQHRTIELRQKGPFEVRLPMPSPERLARTKRAEAKDTLVQLALELQGAGHRMVLTGLRIE